MKLGMLTGDPEALKQIAAIGFDSVSFTTGPGRALDASRPETIRGAVEEARKLGLEVTAIGFYGNPLVSDSKERKTQVEYWQKLLDLAAELQVKVVTGFPGRGEAESVRDVIGEFGKVFGPIAEKAEDLGIRIAFENWKGGGFFTPADWEAVFREVTSPALGLEFDPSHLLLQFVDPIPLVYEFGERIYHVHAKDTEILRENLQKFGLYGKSPEERWGRFRIPGLGELDWREFFGALLDVGFEGGVSIEHEDPVLSGDRFWEGARWGYNFLRGFVPKAE